MNFNSSAHEESDAEWHAAINRLTPLVDGVEYYPALRDALRHARKQVFIIGWDLHTEIDLLRGDEAEKVEQEEDWPYRLDDLLLAMVDANEELDIRLLIWEGSPLFIFERQHLPRMLRPWAKHPRIELVWDRDTPRLSSHHQKMVCIDDTVAFAGGMDLTAGRWDTHRHPRNDERRQMPGLFSKESQPYHDVSFVLDGEGAKVLGGWARERWLRATGEPIDAPEMDTGGDDPWPASVTPAFRDQTVEFALTDPAFRDRPEKRQVESSYIHQIAEAQRLIYIESQYLSCAKIVDALCDRLQQEEGPEVIIVLPYGCPGALQAMSMDPQRDLLLDRLREADKKNRFAAYWMTLCSGNLEDYCEDAVYIHAKTMVIDDQLLRIGSANLNNRSMGVDTELDMTLRIAEDDEEGVAGVRHYRQRLAAYLLHETADALAEAEVAHGGMLPAIEALRGGRCSLYPFDHRAGPFESTFSLAPELADPERPLSDMDADKVMGVVEQYAPQGQRLRRRMAVSVGLMKRKRKTVVGVALVILAILLWTLTPLRELTDLDRLQELFEKVQSSPAGIVGVGVAFILLATVGFPLTVLVAATGALLNAVVAIPLCIVGVTVSAFFSYSIGQFAPGGLRAFIDRHSPDALRERLSNFGVVEVVILRYIPIAPFAVVNIACGMVGVPRGRFLLGNLLGLIPPIFLLTILGQEAMDMLSHPSPANFAKVGVVALVTIGVAVIAERLLRKFDGQRNGANESER